jgi:predicted nucleic acid-binding protein
MKVIVDTNVWSLALRKADFSASNPYVRELRELISEGRVQMIGPIRQEILSGIKLPAQFTKLAEYLSYFPDHLVHTEDYVKAAEFFNICRRNGIQGSNTDFLICSVSLNNDFSILTADEDFLNFKKILTILKLMKPRF